MTRTPCPACGHVPSIPAPYGHRVWCAACGHVYLSDPEPERNDR